MSRTLSDRVTVIETEFNIISKNILNDLKDVKADIRSIAVEIPELLRRVSEHHNFIKNLKNNPSINSDREHKQRKTDQPRYKYIFWSAVATGTAGIISTILLLIFK